MNLNDSVSDITRLHQYCVYLMHKNTEKTYKFWKLLPYSLKVWTKVSYFESHRMPSDTILLKQLSCEDDKTINL